MNIHEQVEVLKQKMNTPVDTDPELRIGDALFVLHKEEMDTLDEILCRALKEFKLTKAQKRHVLNVLKYVQEG